MHNSIIGDGRGFPYKHTGNVDAVDGMQDLTANPRRSHKSSATTSTSDEHFDGVSKGRIPVI